MTSVQQTKSVEYANSMDQIGALVKAHVPYIWVLTHEEKRFIENFYAEIAEKQKKELWTWSSYSGLLKYVSEDDTFKRASGDMDKTWMPNIALDKIISHKRSSDRKGAIFIMKDYHTVLQQPIPRQMRDMYQTLIDVQKTVIILGPCIAHGSSGRSPGMEPTLDKQIVVVEYELPDRDSIMTRVTETIEHIKDNNKGKKIETQLDYTSQEYNTFATALQGLTEIEIDNALFTSITHLKRVDEKRLLLEKKQIIKKSQILEYIGHAPSMNEVGGLDEAKRYFEMYQDQFTPEAREFGVEPLRGVMLTGVPGCVAGDTVVKYNRGRRSDYREISVEKLYRRFNQKEDHYSWDPEIPTHLHSFDGEGKLVKNRVLGVIDSGVKSLVKVTIALKDGSKRMIKLTPDHPIARTDGNYVPAGDLLPTEPIVMKGTMKPQFNGGKKIKIRPKRRVVETLKYHQLAPGHVVNGSYYQRCNYARLVIEAHMNSMTPDQFIDQLKTNNRRSKTFKYLPSNYDVHHLDENPMNDEISNLMVIEHDEHSQLHSKVENFGVDYVQEGLVESIEPCGEEQTYDIQMEYPHNNFVANDIVVHNTGKSLLAKAISAQWNLPLLRLDVGKVMTGLVGGSEEKMRQVIGQAEAIAPCVLWIDEIEKSLSGTKSSNFSDGGTLSRVFGTLLTAMEERFDGVVTIATSNDIQALPPELIRRFNEVLFVDLPVPEERDEIFRIHMTKRGRDADKLGIDMPALVAASHKFTGSELEKAVKEAITRSWMDGHRELTTEDVLGAIKDTKAIAIIMGEKISQIRDWARNRARYASSLAAAEAAPGKQKVTTDMGRELDLGGALDDLDEVVVTKKEELKVQIQEGKGSGGRAKDLLDD